MDRSSRAGSSSEQEKRLQALSETFQEAWKKATSVNIQSYLPPAGDPLRHRALCELIKAELPIRWQRQQKVLLEQYLKKYPELGSAGALPPAVIFEEFRVRQLHGEPVTLDEYRRRFPGQYPALEAMMRDSRTVVGVNPAASGPPSASASASASNFATIASSPAASSGPPSAPSGMTPAPAVNLSAIHAAASLTINGYKLTKRLGSGSFAEVWEGEAPGGFPVAVKRVMKPMDDDAAQRELASLESIKTLRHPFLLQTQTSFFHENHLYIVMELADGTLRDRAKECQKQGLPGIPLPELLLYFREAAEALDYMHAKHLIHRDVKPQNILLSNGHTKVADFGLAAALEVDKMLMSASGSGTPAYMAPEVWQRKVSPRSDQYSLAFAYAEQRLGRWVFSGRDLPSLMIAHLQSDPELDPLPAPEQVVLRKALAKDPANRYATCQGFVQALEDSLADELHRHFPAQSHRNSLSAHLRHSRAGGGTTHADDGTGELSNPTATQPMSPTLAPPPLRRRLLTTFLVGWLLLSLAGGLFWFFGIEHGKASSGFDLLVPGARTLHVGEAGAILVQVRRDSYTGPIEVRFAGLPAHCTAASVTIPAGASEAHALLLVGPDAAPAASQVVTVQASAGDLQQEGELRLTLEPLWYKLPADWRPAPGAVLTALRNKAYYDKIDVGPRDVPARFLLVPYQKDGDPPTFYIMEDKVWVALFRKFAGPGRAMKNREWEEEVLVNRTNKEFPVMGVVAADAEQFARWLGGELPTTRQWDRAFGQPERGRQPAAGPHKKPYAPGEFGLEIDLPLPRGQATRDRSPVGARDMAANGLEWTSVASGEIEDRGLRTPNLGELTSGDLLHLRGARYKGRSTPLSYAEIAQGAGLKPPLPGEGAKVDDTVGFRVVLELDR